ncbi:MAG: hypothetical protein ACI3ZL_04255 [Candidatus Cryptobacteroides sp.]
MMCRKYSYWLSTCFWTLLALLFFGVMLKSFGYDAVKMWIYSPKNGNMRGLTFGFAAYAIFLLFLISPKIRHNLDWFMHFTHELTHTLVALLFFRKIEEFQVSKRDCHVIYQKSSIGYLPITLSPYCIPIYTFMLFPFRYFGASQYMFAFDVMIAFTYAFHIHSFVKYTRYTQSDIEGCGLARSTAFISFVHCTVLALILSMPRSGMKLAIQRVFVEYPLQLLTDPSGWLNDVTRFL